MRQVDQCISDVAHHASAHGLSASAIERFLRTGEETWDGAGSGHFTREQIKQHEMYRQAAKTALRQLFDRLAGLLPGELRMALPVTQESVRQRVEPVVRGLVPLDWQDIALRELTRRTFVLNFPGTQAALDAELSTGWLRTTWQILWAYFEDHGLKPDQIEIEYDGLSSGEFAHVRWAAYETSDPYGDVVVHEAAHLLHYLKPEHYGLRVRRGQERFIDVEFRDRELFAFACEAFSRVRLRGERKARVAFAARMREEAFSFSQEYLEEVAALVVAAASARNGWRTILDSTVRHQRKSGSGTAVRPYGAPCRAETR
jgi:hypothetical protein